MNLANKKVLLTGGRGMLGTYTRLLLSNLSLACVLSPTRDEMDLSLLCSVENYLIEHKPDIVIHLAATVYGLGGNMSNPILSLTSNTLINNNLFSALAKFPVEHIFFASTVAGYPFSGATPNISLKEADFFSGMPHDGEFGYAMAKRHAYSYLKLLKRVCSTRFTYGIFTNLYGRYDRFDSTHGHVIPSLVAKSFLARERSEPLVVWGNPQSTRDFMHAADASSALIHLITKCPDLEVVNISSGNECPIANVAEMIARFSNVSSVVYDHDRPVGISRRVVDNTKLVQSGFQCSVPIETGLLNLVEWFAGNRASARM